MSWQACGYCLARGTILFVDNLYLSCELTLSFVDFQLMIAARGQTARRQSQSMHRDANQERKHQQEIDLLKAKVITYFFILIFIFRATNLGRIVIAVIHEKNFLFIKFWLFLVECCIEKSNNRASTSTSQYAPESKSTTRNRFIKSKGDCMLYYFDIQFSSNQCKHFGQNCNRCRLWKKFPIHWVLFIFSWIMYRENYQGSVRKIVRISKGCRILLPRWGICYFFSMFRIYI